MDICWTLFYSNTTFDFLDWLLQEDKGYIRLRTLFRSWCGRYANLLLYRLAHYDLQRHLAIRHLKGMSQETLLLQADNFFNYYLQKNKIKEVWDILPSRNIIIASGTLDIIADTVARHIGAQKVYASHLEFKDGICTGEFMDFLLIKDRITEATDSYNIVTDNLSDIALVNKAQHATIVTYNNQQRWQHQLNGKTDITYINIDMQRY